MKKEKAKSKLPKEVLKFLSDMGKKGGASKSPAKKKASAENGKKGGRPLGSKNKPKGEKP